MEFSVKSASVDAAVRQLVILKDESLTEITEEIVENEWRRPPATLPLSDRLTTLSDRYAAYPPTPIEADKVFFDDLSGEL